MGSLTFLDQMDEVSKTIERPEQMLGRGLRQPFNGCNAGARKIMFSTHSDHIFPLIESEKAIIETGYEIRYGDWSSSVLRADANYQIVAKISKFSFAPNHHYWLILKDINEKRLEVVERISYEHITESYGYLFNNEVLDSLQPGAYIQKDTILQKSLAFDEYNNRKDGRNFNVAYMALDDNMEDSIIMSQRAADKLVSPLVNVVRIPINDNDIPLNIYGDERTYKVIPDIGEDVKDANLIGLRKEKKEEALFSQSVDRLRKFTMSDERRQVRGKVIDINIYCNNPDILETHYYEQLKLYYNELQRQSAEFVKTILPYVSEGFKLEYELEKLFAISKRICNHDQYIDKRTFSNIILEVVVLEDLPMLVGDKAANRYGGKGIVSSIWPNDMMPRFKNTNGDYDQIDVIFNSSTMIGRENTGQCFELSLTHIGAAIIEEIKKGKYNLYEAFDLIKKYVEFCSPEQAQDMEDLRQNMSQEDLMFYIESIINDGDIQLSMRPISDTMTIDKLNAMYKAFPFVKQNRIEVALRSSDGSIRYVKSRKPVVVGKQYIYRLKQFAEEKFSATSLSSTNIKNENTKSKAKKDFKELYPNTPIRFGNMETNNMNHIGADAVIANMMTHSLSPQGRRLVESMYTEDPFHVDIKLDSNSRNRSAEIAATYLKTIGRRIVFIKNKKHRQKIAVSAVYFEKDPIIYPVSFVPESEREGFDYEQDFKDRQKDLKSAKRRKAISPFYFEGIERKEKRD
jgi:DNA-directed RNA polymerase beta subunit